VIDKEELAALLGLPDIEIERIVREESKTLKIYVKSTKEGTVCHGCGKPITTTYGRGQEIVLRHLPMFGYKTFIVMTPMRYVCHTCKGRPTTTQTLSWYTRKSTCTIAYEQDVMRSLINSTIHDVSLKHDLGTDTIQGIIDRQVATEVDWDTIPTLEVIGIDEIALKKGHRDFVTIVSAYVRNELQVIGILDNREKVTVEKFFLSIPKRLSRTVKMVCSDLYRGFMSAVKAVFGRRVMVCADRFHVAKLYREGLNSMRKREMKRLHRLLSKKDLEKFKSAHWVIRKRRAELTSDERQILNLLFQHSPKLREAYELCEALTAIFDAPLSRGQGKRRLRGWMQRVTNRNATCFNRFLKTLENHLEEISNYFVTRQTSGFVEGLNNKIKVLKRRCYGIMHTGHLFQRVCLDLNGYTLFPV
jgi:transposase